MSQGVDRLKELLFDKEARKLDELNGRLQLLAEAEIKRHGDLSERVNAVFERAGTAERLQQSVADVLDGAIRDAEIDKHEALSQAVAPLVVNTIKYELKNSQDDMVDALYPITGRLVKQYVAAAVKDMMVQINSRLSGGSGGGLGMRLKSIMTGTSMSELALAETQRLEVEELFLIRRGSGDLVAQWDRTPRVQGQGSNRDALVAPYLVAINAFAEDAFDAGKDSMRTLDMGESRIYLRSSPAYLLAAKCTGSGPAAVEKVIDDKFLGVLNDYRAALAEPAADRNPGLARILPGLARTLDASLAEKHAELAPSGSGSFAPLYAMSAIILLPLIGWFTYSMWQTYQTGRTREAVLAVIGTVPEASGYPIQVDVDWGGRAYAVTGLAPSPEIRDGLIERLHREVSYAEVRDRLVPVASGVPGDPAAIAELRRGIAGVEQELWRAPIRRAAERAEPRFRSVAGELALLAPQLTTPSERTEVGRAIAALKDADGLIGALRRDVIAPETTRARMAAEMSQLRARLLDAETAMTTVIGRQPQAIPKASADPADVAEELSLQAERLSGLTLTLERTLPLKPLAGKVADLEQRLNAIRIPEPAAPVQVVQPLTPRQRLEAFARAHAIFFAANSDYADEPAAQGVVDNLAKLIIENDLLVRVVGYTDDRGTPQRNSVVAASRADRVVAELIARGVPSDRVVSIARPQVLDINPVSGLGSNNRRVEFEVGFVGERGRR